MDLVLFPIFLIDQSKTGVVTCTYIQFCQGHTYPTHVLSWAHIYHGHIYTIHVLTWALIYNTCVVMCTYIQFIVVMGTYIQSWSHIYNMCCQGHIYTCVFITGNSCVWQLLCPTHVYLPTYATSVKLPALPPSSAWTNPVTHVRGNTPTPPYEAAHQCNNL